MRLSRTDLTFAIVGLLFFAVPPIAYAWSGPPDQTETRFFAANSKQPGPCELRKAGDSVTVAAAARAMSTAGSELASLPEPASCPPFLPLVNWYQHFVTGPQAVSMTPKQKGWLAMRNVGNPYNLATIFAESAISVGADSHSPYGPGVGGWAYDAGDSLLQDATGEFFGTFLIPSLTHQDPYYHRMASSPVVRRALHAIVQVVRTQGDNGRPMPNYANLIGFACDDEIANLYLPGRQTNAHATADRYLTGLATAPLDNFVAEFAPDLARHFHVRIVIVQRIINRLDTPSQP